jgi:hypothetical protein
MQRQLQDPVGTQAEMAVRPNRMKSLQPRTTCPHDELADSVGTSQTPVWRLGSEALVVVVVAVDHELGTCSHQRAPEGTHGPVVPVRARAEARVVPDREGAEAG